MNFILAAVAFLSGGLFPIQTAVNAQLGRSVGGALIATMVSFVVGFAALVAIWLATSRDVPRWTVLQGLPPYLFTGGLLGATFLGLSVFLVPRLGSATTLCCAIAGQILASLAIDRFGLFGLAARDLTPMRVVGALLVAAGVFIVRLY